MDSHESTGATATLETVPITADQARAWQPSAGEVQAHVTRNADLAYAASAPLPGPAADAFAADGTTRIHGFTLLPVTGGHIAVLTALQSPFLLAIRITMARALAKTDDEKAAIDEKAKETEVTIEDIAEAMFVLTHSPSHSRSILKMNKASFREVALNEVLDKLPPFPNLDSIGAQIGEHYARSFVTALNFEAAPDGKGASINFPPAPSPKTALAGSQP